jgi:hypothetical protein
VHEEFDALLGVVFDHCSRDKRRLQGIGEPCLGVEDLRVRDPTRRNARAGCISPCRSAGDASAVTTRRNVVSYAFTLQEASAHRRPHERRQESMLFLNTAVNHAHCWRVRQRRRSCFLSLWPSRLSADHLLQVFRQTHLEHEGKVLNDVTKSKPRDSNSNLSGVWKSEHGAGTVDRRPEHAATVELNHIEQCFDPLIA